MKKRTNKRGKAIAALLCAAVMMTTLSPALAAEEGNGGPITGTLTYSPSMDRLGVEKAETSFTYDDDNFTKSGYDYTKALAEQSMEFALSSNGASGREASQANEDQISYLTQCGFEDYMANEAYVTKPGRDTIGVGIAKKTIRDNAGEYTLLAVGIRGHNYYTEWASNGKIGQSGDYEGFADSRNKALAYLKQYIREKNVTGRVKIWVVGYSRSSATANLLGASLDDGAALGDGVSLSRHDLYVYTFEAPRGTVSEHAHDPVYGNIHNIVNPNDLVTYLGPVQWGFERYGVDHELPSSDKDADYALKLASMMTEFSKLEAAGPYMVDLVQTYTFREGSLIPVQKVATPDFNVMVTEAVTTDFVSSREEYYEEVQADLSELLGTLFSLGNGVGKTAISYLASNVSDNASELMGTLLSGDRESAKAQFLSIVLESLEQAGVQPEYDEQQVSDMLDNLMGRLMNMAVKNPDVTASLLANALFILNAHFPEVNTAWVRSLPEEYMTAQQPYEYSGAFTDVSGGDWYAPYADYVWYGTLMAGDENGAFRPEDTLTRGMFVQILYALEGRPAVSGSMPFTDGSGWYRDAVLWAYQNGITGGVTATSFAPEEAVTREQMALMLRQYRLSGGAAAEGASLDGFADASSVSDWALEGVQWAVAAGVMAGDEESRLCPQDPCTRAEAAVMIRGFCEK